MASSVHYPVDDKDLDDAELWAVIDSAAASHSSSKRKPLAIKQSPNILSHGSISQISPKINKMNSLNNQLEEDVRAPIDGEVVQEPRFYGPPRKIAKPNSSCFGEDTCNNRLAVVKNLQSTPELNSPGFGGEDYNNNNQMVVVKNLKQTPTTPTPSSSYSSPDTGRYSVQEVSPTAEVSPFNFSDDDGSMKHSLLGRFPSVSLFKDYQNAAMAILEKTDYTMISGNPFIKKTGWRKISFYFNLSFEIKDKSIEFDENRNVQRAEFVARAHMQGGRFSDGWGSCDRREKRFLKPNHDIPSTAETRAKNKACQDLLGIGEYRPGSTSSHR
ncbi:hypothetical protein MKW94_025695 [Papaver nudicaule]|uniref:Uncharacterized protein n=1 Tax=Papaver nudicaule TaxID=74823 RepID=A0AA41V629_PAPNU|nr:hypothetical protein [Papaver nudicaule]